MVRSLFCAVAVSVWTAVAGGTQTPSANPLPPPVRSHVNSDRFDVVTSVRGLPLAVRDQLQTLFRSPTLDIAEPGAAFRGGAGTPPPDSPSRRLVAAACSIDHCMVYYERSGNAHTWYLTLFHWTPAATRFEWGGMAPAGLKTIDQLRAAALSGAIRASDSW